MQLAIFQSEILIRPDDIDMNNHVHNAKYLDYVQAARYMQMRDNYKYPMEQYHQQGYNWFASEAHIIFKRSLKFGDTAIVKTQIREWNGASVGVNFWILSKNTNKLAAEGYMVYTLVSITSGKPVRIPEEIIEKHQIFNTGDF
jgi:acyl-CoA thioester hydrolase/thioesterase-3